MRLIPSTIPKDRHQHDLMAYFIRVAYSHRGFDPDFTDRDVFGNLVGQQSGDLIHKVLEVLRTGLLPAQLCELMGDKRVLEYF
jgi:hypothetical protein